MDYCVSSVGSGVDAHVGDYGLLMMLDQTEWSLMVGAGMLTGVGEVEERRWTAS